MVRRGAALLIASFLSFVLVSCSGGQSEPEENQTGPDAPPQTASEACSIATGAVEEISDSWGSLIRFAVTQESDSAEDPQELLLELQDPVASAQEQVTEPEVRTALDEYAAELDAMVNVFLTEIETPDALSDQSKIDAFTAKLDERGQVFDDRRHKLHDLCAG